MRWRPSAKEAFDALGSATPICRVGDPSETGAVAAFLASSDSITGGEVFVDGGLAQVQGLARGGFGHSTEALMAIGEATRSGKTCEPGSGRKAVRF